MREKKKTIIKPKKRDEEVNEFAHEAEVQGDLSHEEAVAPPVPDVPAAPVTSEAGLTAPQLHGKKRVGKGPKKFESETDNKQTRIVEGGPELDEEKPDLDDGEPELED
jgi:hypothetical protein